MARGWESKDVESQMELAEERRVRSQAAAEIDSRRVSLARERESIELSRTRVKADMENSVNPRYRSQLEQSLKFLDEKLVALESKPESGS